MKQKLANYRLELDNFMSEFLKQIVSRKKVVAKIHELKQGMELEPWDPLREKDIFLKFSNVLSQLSLQELLSISLIMESHARDCNLKYPAWSERAHLEGNLRNQFSICQLINPVLLFVCAKSQFSLLHLKYEFLSKIIGQIDQ